MVELNINKYCCKEKRIDELMLSRRLFVSVPNNAKLGCALQGLTIRDLFVGEFSGGKTFNTVMASGTAKHTTASIF